MLSDTTIKNATNTHTHTHVRRRASPCGLQFSEKQPSEVAGGGELDHWGEFVHLVKSHSYGVSPALTSVLCNGGGWQRCAPSLSVLRGIKTALRSSLYTRMRWKIWALSKRSAVLTSMKTKGKASNYRCKKKRYKFNRKWIRNKRGNLQNPIFILDVSKVLKL